MDRRIKAPRSDPNRRPPETAGSKTDQTPFTWLLLTWLAMAPLVWTIVVLLALVFIPHKLDAGLLAAPIVLVLGAIPVGLCTVAALIVLYLVGKRLFPESPRSWKMMVLLGAAPLTLLMLWLLTVVVGGVEFFIPRL